MTHLEMKKLKRRRVFHKVLDVAVAFSLGIIFFWGLSTLATELEEPQEMTQKIEHTGEVIVHVVVEYVPAPEIESEPVQEEPVAEEEVEEFKSYYTYTEEELDLLSRLIFSEGGTESYETKLKIGSVVMNRVTEDANFPDTIHEVIYQKNQFSVTTSKINGVVMIDRPADEESKRAAKEVLDYGSVLPHDVQVFYAKGCKGDWINSREVYGTYDRTVFAYIYPKGGKV